MAGPVTVVEPAQVRVSKAQPVEIAPQILHLDGRSVTFSWKTRSPVTGRLELVGPGGAADQESVFLEEGPPSMNHRLSAANLVAGSRYRYLVDGRFAGSFETATPGEPIKFGVFGHPGGTATYAAFPVAHLATTLDGMGLDFALCTGDMCNYTSAASFKRFYFDPFARFLASRPIYAAAANHEGGYPTSQGKNFDVFRELFPYEFPGEKHAYHSFVRGNVEFFACAYAPARTKDHEEQLEWLAEALTASRSEFRVVFLGGAQNPAGFDRSRFFRTAKDNGADLAFGGDGSGVSVSQVEGLDYFFAGTAGRDPRPFFLADADPYQLEVTRRDTRMAKLLGSWRFESKRPKTLVKDAMAHAVDSPRERAMLFSGLALPSTHFHGFRVRIQNPSDHPVLFWSLWSPEGTRKSGDYFFRNEARFLDPHSTSVHHFVLPQDHPRTGQPWTLDEIELRVMSSALPEGFELSGHVEEVAVFSDPLQADR
ncbi:MAG: hypothetical protein ACJAQ3_001291 [Planctomycetota bacterium]